MIHAVKRSWLDKHQHSISLARAFLAYAVVPNLPFCIAACFIPIRQGLNVDYLAVLFLALFCAPVISRSLLAVVFLLEALTVWLSFYFAGDEESLYSARFIFHLPWQRTVASALLLALFALAIAGATELAAGRGWKRDRARGVSVIGTLLLSLTVLTILSTDPIQARFWRHKDRLPRVFFSVGLHMAKTTLLRDPAQDAVFSGGRVPGATAAYLDGSARGLRTSARNVVLVLVESYGFTFDPSLSAQLTSPFLRPAVSDRYDVRFSSVPFRGSTVSGELRELCGLQLPMSAFHKVPSLAANCLPQTLGRMGYHSTALHGFTKHMFDRVTWWKEIGFQRTLFFEDMASQPGNRTCKGPFPAICDADMVRSIRSLLLAAPRNEPQFVYWVSVNSHLPLSASSGVSAGFHCGQKSAAIQDPDLCAWGAVIYIVNDSLAQLATDPALPPTDFIIVGDHAPPFFLQRQRKQFSYTEVRAIYLTSKQ